MARSGTDQCEGDRREGTFGSHGKPKVPIDFEVDLGDPENPANESREDYCSAVGGVTGRLETALQFSANSITRPSHGEAKEDGHAILKSGTAPARQTMREMLGGCDFLSKANVVECALPLHPLAHGRFWVGHSAFPLIDGGRFCWIERDLDSVEIKQSIATDEP